MHRFLNALGAALFGLTSSAAAAADLPATAVPVGSPFSWAGLYVGGHAGALIGATNFSDPFGPSVFGDKVTSPGFMAGLQIGYNWVVAPRWILGVEGSGSLLDADGDFTCLQASITTIGANCRSVPKGLATLTGRLGAVVDPERRTLIYGKAGAAWSRTDLSLAPANAFSSLPNNVTVTGSPLLQGNPVSTHAGVWGWTVGAGFERALTPAWSLSVEYDYHRFSSSVATPETLTVTPTSPTSVVVASIPAGATSHVSQDLHIVKLGLNYHWDVAPTASWFSESAAHGPAISTKAPPVPQLAGWEFEGGSRYWYSSGRFQSDFPKNGSAIVSRLTYDNMTGHTGELFARVDSPANVFVKGFVGAGSIASGRQFDEDWGILGSVPTSFEVTRSDISGSISYATGDIGFNVMRGPDHKVGLFAGYNYFHAYMGTQGCMQLVAPGSGICAPPSPGSAPGTSETDTWNSLRIGLSAETRVWDRFKINGDFAYLPYVHFDGLDNHRARDTPTTFPTSGTGRGVQAELILSYLVTDNLSVGVGGRYWAMWTTNASQSCIGGCNLENPIPVVSPPGPGKVNTERFGGFLQASYRFDTLR